MAEPESRQGEEASHYEDCPDEEVLLAYAEGRLGSSLRAEVELHISTCSDCLALTCVVARSGPSSLELAKTQADSVSACAPPLARGTMVGRYRVVRLLGEGAMGSVYEAHDPRLDRSVALKLVRAARLGDATLRDRLVREARSMAKLSHRNVVTVFDAGELGADFFIAMELVPGSTLGQWLQRSEASPEEVLSLFLEAGRGLAAAHAAGIVHRDFKPANVLVDPKGRVAVTDFGLADAPLEAAGTSGDGGDGHVSETRSGTVLGTPRYMSPEQHAGDKVDARGDQFSFAVALYEALHHERPFPGETLEELLASLRRGPAPPPLGTIVPPYISRALERALSANPEDRFPTLEALLTALSPPAEVRPRWARVGAGFFLVVALMATIGGTMLLGRATGGPTTLPKPNVGSGLAPPSRRPGGRTPVLVAQLKNSTGDPSFDDPVDALLVEILGASKRLDTYAPYLMKSLGQELGLHGSVSDETIGRALLLRDGGRVVLARPSIERTSSGWRLGVLVLNVESGEVLASEEAETTSKEAVLERIPRLGSAVRARLGDERAGEEGERLRFSTSFESVRRWAEGMRLTALGEAAQGIAVLRASLVADPSFVLAHVELGHALRNDEQPLEAAKESELALSAKDQLSERRRLNLLADHYSEIGRYTESMAAYEQVLSRWPGDRSAEISLAETAIRAGEWPLAIELARRATEDHPEAVTARQDLVTAELAVGSFADTVREGEAATERFPSGPPENFSHLVSALVLLGHGADAARVLDDLTRLDEEWGAESRADVAFYEGRLDDATRLLEREVSLAAQRDADSGDSRTEHIVLGEIALRRGDRKRAALEARAARRGAESDSNETILFLISHLLIAAGVVKEAEGLATTFARNPSLDARVFRELLRGEIRDAQGDAEGAMLAYREAEVAGDTWLVHAILGDALLARRAFPEAARELQRCIDRRGEAAILATPSLRLIPPVYFKLAIAKESAHDTGAALAFHAFLDLEPRAQDDPLAVEAHRRLAVLERAATRRSGP